MIATLNDTSDFYDAIAEHYPLFYRDWETQLEREGLSLRALFRNKGITRVLDASCGAGTQAVALAQLGFDVIAADPSPGMLKKANEIAADTQLKGDLEFQRADFLHLDEIIDGTFDAVIAKGNSLPHLLTDEEIELTLHTFYEFLRPGGLLIIGMRDFGLFMEERPGFIPGMNHELDDGAEFITFEIWEWQEGPPVIATQNLFIVQGQGKHYTTTKHRVSFRPLSTDEVKVVLLEAGFEDITDQPDRTERVLVARKPLGIA